MRRHILTVSYSAIQDDPRVMMEGGILASLGYRVSVVGVAFGTMPGSRGLNGMTLTVLPLVNDHTPAAVLRATWALMRRRVVSASSPDRRSTYLSLLFFNLWVFRIAMTDRPGVIHCQEHQPLPSAWLVARFLGARLVYDAHENTSLNMSGIGYKGAMTIRLERFFLSRVDAVITVGERLARALIARGARRVAVIGNWKRSSDYLVEPSELEGLRSGLGLPVDCLVVSYIGLLDPTRDVEPLLNAVAGTTDVHLLIAGRGRLEEWAREMAEAHQNIHWLGWLPLDRVASYTQVSDVIFVGQNRTLKQLEFQMPNKLFDVFAAGKAVIARGDIGEMSEVLKRYPAAIELDEVTPGSIQEAFWRLRDPEVLRALQDHARSAGREFNTDVAEARLADLFGDLFRDIGPSS